MPEKDNHRIFNDKNLAIYGKSAAPISNKSLTKYVAELHHCNVVLQWCNVVLQY